MSASATCSGGTCSGTVSPRCRPSRPAPAGRAVLLRRRQVETADARRAARHGDARDAEADALGPQARRGEQRLGGRRRRAVPVYPLGPHVVDVVPGR